MKICIDAGHYGKYNQSPCNKAYWESDFSWKFHLLLKAELEKYGITVITTRTEQTKDLELTARGRKSAGCDLFLSIHSNACSDPSADYPLACCCVSGQADVLGHELANAVAKLMGSKGKARIWRREGNGKSDYYGVLRGAAAVGTPGILMEHGFHTNLANTNWLLNESNLRRMAEVEADVIAQHYSISPEPIKTTTEDTAQRIWNRLTAAGFTAAGTAGLMGNLKAESNLIPTNLQNTFESKLGYTDMTYTQAVDSGKYTKFATDGAGYGIAQWTYHTRKDSLLSFAKQRGKSIGDLDMQIEFLINEIKTSFKSLDSLLRSVSDVKQASDAVLTQFERPADMSDAVKQKRYNFSMDFYNTLREPSNTPTEKTTVHDTVQVTMQVNGKTYSGVLVAVE